MRTLRPLLAATSSLALAMAAAPAVSAGPPPPTTVQATDDASGASAPIEQQVLTELAEDGETTVWVRFDARPDMSQFDGITDWDARGVAVYEALTSTADAAQADVRADLDAAGLTYTSHWATNAILVEDADGDVVNDIARSVGVEGIYGTFEYEPPEPLPAEADNSFNAVEWGVQDIRAHEVWAEGVTGEGIVVANLDSGVQWDHPALINQYRGWDGTTADHDYNWFDGSGDNEPAPWDWDGHGTHTMGTMVGDDGGTNQIGVAPGAQWIAASTDLSDAMMIAAGEWFLAPTEVGGANPDATQRPHVVNNSWGSELPSNDPFMEDVIEAWHASGIFSVFSNGNEGPACATSGSPGSRIVTYSVGSYDAFHNISGFSSRGPGQDGEIKPNIAAPGSDVRSSFPGDTYGTISGTSMAAPHVSAAVALLWSADASVAREVTTTRTLLDDSAIDTEDLQCGGTADDNNVFGEGRLDAYALIFGDEPPAEPPMITVDPTLVENTQAPDQVTAHTLTVGNDGGADLEFMITETEGGGDGALEAPVLPQGADRANASTEAAEGPAAPAVVEPAAVPAVASLSEGFDDITTLPGAGWAIANNSEPVGGTSWFQGNPEVFEAHEGAPEAYVAANFNSAGDAPGNISNWLMTPELDLVNGSEFSFWTRVPENPATWVDRLEVRLSTSGDSTDVGTGYEGVGDFDTVLLSVNPDLTATDYPGEWTQYTATIEGLEAPTAGRVAFHYWVPAGGPLGDNSNFIGVDTVSYEAVDAPPACETTDAPWLSVAPATGTVAPGATQDVTVTLDSTGLAVGEHSAVLCVESNDPATPTLDVPVTLTVTDPPVPVIGVDPVEVAVELESGESGSAAVAVSNTGEADLDFDVVEATAGTCDPVDATWLSVDPVTGTVAPGGSQYLALALDTAGLAAGVHTADLCVESNDAVTPSVSVAVTLTVTDPPPAPVPVIGVDPVEVAVELESGESGSAAVAVSNTGEADLDFDVVEAAAGSCDLVDATWLSVDPATGTVAPGGSQDLALTLDAAGLAAGVHTADLCVQSNDAVTPSVSVAVTLTVTDPPEPAEVIRIDGADRYATTALIAAEFPEGASTVYVANGLDERQGVDALVTGAVAGGGPETDTDGPAPILLVKTDAIPLAITAALEDLDPDKIVIVGGPVAVDASVEAELAATGADVSRIAGDDRFETAAAMAQGYPTSGTVYVATGTGPEGAQLALADALTAASVAGHHHVPVLLTQTDNLPNATEAALADLAPSEIVLVGGPVAVDEGVLEELLAIAPTTRVWGENRYETAVALTAGYLTDTDRLYVASGINFPDALVGAALTASQDAPLLITRPDLLPAVVGAEAERLSPQGITIFGGPIAVSTVVEEALQTILDVTSLD